MNSKPLMCLVNTYITKSCGPSSFTNYSLTRQQPNVRHITTQIYSTMNPRIRGSCIMKFYHISTLGRVRRFAITILDRFQVLWATSFAMPLNAIVES